MSKDRGEARLSGPHKKDEASYLSWSDWYGDPVPSGRIGPWGLGQTCWWYLAEWPDGGRRVFAAETPERALAAAQQWNTGVLD